MSLEKKFLYEHHLWFSLRWIPFSWRTLYFEFMNDLTRLHVIDGLFLAHVQSINWCDCTWAAETKVAILTLWEIWLSCIFKRNNWSQVKFLKDCYVIAIADNEDLSSMPSLIAPYVCFTQMLCNHIKMQWTCH